ncbi:MAG: glucose-1-phosphate thymidylyltransferase [Vampirovibrionales bacterium]|nr:glucose-1-phosphate thymidylyltransferase [Vampirovibrionales bacterium]
MRLKALILAGGTGTRLRPLTYAIPKQLVPVANLPILHHVLNLIAAAGIDEIGVITNPETSAQIETSVASWQQGLPAQKVACTFISQPAPLGLAHAVATAKDFIANSPFVMILGDNLINVSLASLIDPFLAQPEQQASLLLKAVEAPERFGVAVLNDNAQVIRLIEKPKVAPSNLALVGIYLFRASIFQAIEHLQPSARGELEITDAIQGLIDANHLVRAQCHDGWWLDTGKKDDLLAANRIVLEELPPASAFYADSVTLDETTLNASVQIGEGSSLKNCHISGPVVIGQHCSLSNVSLGPYTSIGDNATLESCHIEESVLLPGITIAHWPVAIRNSLMGHHVQLIGQNGLQVQGQHSLCLADDSILRWEQAL